MSRLQLLQQERFPRSSRYDPEWQIDGAYGGNSMWLAEWLCEDAGLKPGMKVLDLGCGRAKSSIFMAREYDVEVWAADFWLPAEENQQRVDQSGLTGKVHCVNAEARDLPFDRGQFDAIVAFDSIQYYGTDAMFLPYVAQFLVPKGILGFASAAMMCELRYPVPAHLQRFWMPDCWSLRTAAWWHEHWSRTGMVDVQFAEIMAGGWKVWLDWAKAIGCSEWYLDTIETDAGQYLGYIRVLANRSENSPDMPFNIRTGEWLS